MALILCLETSSKNCSVSMFRDGKLLAAREFAEGYQHSEKLHLFVKEVVEESSLNLSDLDAVLLGHGPGSFTGLRIGASAAKGFCFALSIPLMTFSSLANMALQVQKSLKDKNQNGRFFLCPMIDARRMEVYSACFDENMKELQEAEALILSEHSFNSLLEQGEVFFFGDGMNKFRDLVGEVENAHFIDEVLPSSKICGEIAEEMFKAQDFEDTAYYEPFYLKAVHLTTPKKQF